MKKKVRVRALNFVFAFEYIHTAYKVTKLKEKHNYEIQYIINRSKSRWD